MKQSITQEKTYPEDISEIEGDTQETDEEITYIPPTRMDKFLHFFGVPLKNRGFIVRKRGGWCGNMLYPDSKVIEEYYESAVSAVTDTKTMSVEQLEQKLNISFWKSDVIVAELIKNKVVARSGDLLIVTEDSSF